MSLNPFKRDKKKYHVTVEDGAVSSDEEFRQSSDNISMGHRLDDDKIAMGMSEVANTTSWDEIDGLEDLARSERANDQQAIENAHKTANMIKNEQKKESLNKPAHVYQHVVFAGRLNTQ